MQGSLACVHSKCIFLQYLIATSENPTILVPSFFLRDFFYEAIQVQNTALQRVYIYIYIYYIESVCEFYILKYFFFTSVNSS